MRTAYDLIGLTVVELETGKRLGKVRDLLIDGEWHVRGIMLDYKQLFSPAHYIGWADVITFGDDALMVQSKDSIRKFEKADDVYFLLGGKRRIKGFPLVTAEGVHLGRVEDVYFSENMENMIVGFELSDGLLTDLREGRKRLPIPAGTKRGRDMILVPAGASREAGTIPNNE